MTTQLPVLVHDYSALSTAARCGQRYRYQYVERLRRPESSVPMHAGNAMHAALNYLYTTSWSFKEALEVLEEAWGGFQVPPASKHAYLTLGHLEIVLQRYMENREKQPTALEQGNRLLSDEEVLIAEEAVVFDWPNSQGETLRVGGKPDLPREIGGQRYIVDHKTTTQWVNSYWALKFKLGHQFRIYGAAMLHLLQQRYAGAYVNAIYIGKEAADPPEKWKTRKSAPNALFGPYDFTPEKLKETRAWVEGWQRTIKLWEELDMWPQNEASCGDFGGCEFMDLCDRPEIMHASIKSRQFVTWEPTGVLLSGADSNEE